MAYHANWQSAASFSLVAPQPICQQLHTLRLVRMTCPVQWRVALFVFHLGIGSGGQKQFHTFWVFRGGAVQRGLALSVFQCHICSSG